MRNLILTTFIILITGICISAQAPYKMTIEDKAGKQYELQPSKLILAHYCTSILGSYYHYPQKYFSQDINVTDIPSFKQIKVVQLKPNLKTSFMKTFEKENLGSPFFNDGSNIYNKGHALVSTDESLDHLIPAFQSKELSPNNYIYSFSIELDTGKIYGYCNGGYSYFFRIKK